MISLIKVKKSVFCQYLCIFVLFAFALTACGAEASHSERGIVGKWRKVDGHSYYWSNVEWMEYFEDGSFVYGDYHSDGTYSILSDGTLLTHVGVFKTPAAYTFKIDGNTITVTNDKGENWVGTR